MNKILVIDDERWLREAVSLALARKGFAVVQAGDGTRGIEAARKQLPDLILCDVNMDDVDGYRTLSLLREDPRTASIPFILMTGSADNAGMRLGMELGADDYLAKPFTLTDLCAAVDARLKKARTMSEQTERKLEDLRDTISTVLPHEMRTPLNGILSLGEILATDAGTLSAGEVAEMGKDIHRAGRRLERLTGNFLIYAQLELIQSDPKKAGTPRKSLTASPVPLIEARVAAEVEEAGRQGDLDLECGDIPLPISEDHLGKIVSELTSNALKFSPPGSVVTIRLEPVGGKSVLSFQDRGRGFSPENLLRIGAYMQFDRRIHEQQVVGLGLVIARMLAELHGGTLSIESKPGEGSKLSLVFSAAP